ncbi:MAG TPA: GNAT family N-acetyltransferase [Armatimonadota bacterium]|jgi:ribosomal protein S18 acetylase RimI-like enzyme
MNAILRPCENADLERLHEISLLAWTPIFASFQQILGASLFAIVFPDFRAEQWRGIEAGCRGEHGASAWVAEQDGVVVGFILLKLHGDTKIGEINYNAVHPEYQNSGIGTMMYEFALTQLREGGMRAANVGTGGDAAHAPARRAYEKVGFQPLPLVNYYMEL